MTNQSVAIELTDEELRYLVACGFALLQHVPADSMPTYTTFTKSEILAFSKKVRKVMDERGIDM